MIEFFVTSWSKDPLAGLSLPLIQLINRLQTKNETNKNNKEIKHTQPQTPVGSKL